MKNLFMCFVISISSVVAFAHDHKEEAEQFNNRGLEVLYKNMHSVKLLGQVKEGENLQVFIQDAADFYGHIFGSIMSMGDDEDDAEVKVSEVAPNCKSVEGFKGTLGSCELRLNYKNGEHVKLVWHIQVKDGKPAHMASDSVMLTRHH